MNSEVIEANRRVHSSLILSGEYQKSPHRSRESIQRVTEILSKLNEHTHPVKHLDIGCGDGFIFECAPKKWDSYGVDATPEMLNECHKNHPTITLKDGLAESLPFEDETFNTVTCYSFLDHLDDTKNFYIEAMRVLKPGGSFYFGLSPNRDFYIALANSQSFDLPELIKKTLDIKTETKKAFDDGSYYEENFGIAKNDLFKCEPGKTMKNGLSPLEEQLKLQELGAQKVTIMYEWIFQQNRIEPSAVKVLNDFLPFTSSCFKYFDLIGIK